MRCFITGTDTGVGKTHFTASLLRSWVSRGQRCAGFKPLSTGSRADAESLLEAASPNLTLEQINPIHLRSPLSPWIAGTLENRVVNIPELARQIQQYLPELTHAAVEGIGGWLTPITQTETAADLAQALGLPVIIVTRASLGTLNHTLLTIESIRRFGLPIQGLIINHHGAEEDLATQTNPQALADLTRLPCLSLHSQQLQWVPLPSWLE